MSHIVYFRFSKIFLALIVSEHLNLVRFTFADVHPDHRTSFGDSAWTIFDTDTLYPCIKLEGAISFRILGDSHFTDETETIFVPYDAQATGHCQSLWGDYQDIRLTWNTTRRTSILGIADESVNQYHSYSIYFGFATSWESEFSNLKINSNEFALNSVTIVVEEGLNHKNPNSYSVSDFAAFLTPKNHTFACSTVNFQRGDLFLSISNFRLLAFNINENKFNNQFQCEADDSLTTHWENIVKGMGLIFVGFFALCLIGVILILLAGGFNNRHDIIAIGYNFVGTGVRPTSSEA